MLLLHPFNAAILKKNTHTKPQTFISQKLEQIQNQN